MKELVRHFVIGVVVGFVAIFILLSAVYLSRSFFYQQCEDIGRIKGTVEYTECIDMLNKGKSIDGLV